MESGTSVSKRAPAILLAAAFFVPVLGLAAIPADPYFSPASGKALFVSKDTGNNTWAGTKDKPVKNLDKAVAVAKAGDTILVAEGSYSGTFDIGFFEIDKPLKFYGGFSKDFSTRDLIAHPTLIQPNNKSAASSRKAMFRLMKAIDGTVVDGFVFDMGLRNSYSPGEGKPEGVDSGMLLLPPAKATGENATVTEPIFSIPSAADGGTVVISNNVFVNGASFAIQAGLRSGKIKVLNNVFVANRMAAIEIYGTSPNKGGPKDLTLSGEVEIAYNTILFTWSRLKDFLDMGYGIRVMTKIDYDIHHNIIGGSVLAGIDHTRFNKNEWLRIRDNVFFVNKQADLEYSPASNTKLNLRYDQFGELEIPAAEGNVGEIPTSLRIDTAYLEGFLSSRYSEETDYDPNSPANMWRSIYGMNQQGTMKSKASMFANRYSWKAALDLFGNVQGFGAQDPAY